MNVFIPIKQNSQRVPGKNFREFKGVPLYQYAINNILETKHINEIYIDTDSEEVLEFYKDNINVIAYRRHPNLVGDTVSVCDLIKYCIVHNDIKNDYMIQLHVTTPLIKQSTIETACNLINGDFDSIVACNKLQTRLWRKEDYGYCPVNHNPTRLEQTQDLPVYYEENSAFYVFSTDDFLRTNNRIGLNPYFYEMTFPENIDIDTEDDWNILKQF